MLIRPSKIGIASIFVILSNGLAHAEPLAIVWDEPVKTVVSAKADGLKTSQLNELSLKKVVSDVVAEPKITTAATDVSSDVTTNAASFSAGAVDDEMMISDAPSAVPAARSAPAIAKPVAAAPVVKSIAPVAKDPSVVVAPLEEAAPKRLAIIWDEPLAEAVPAPVGGQALEDKKELARKELAPSASQKPLEEPLRKFPNKNAPLEPVKPPAAVVAPAPVPVREEIATAGSVNKPMAGGGKNPADQEMVTSLLGKVRILETEKETLRKKLMQIDPGKLKEVYQCSEENQQINQLQNRVDVLSGENKMLKDIGKNSVSIPKLPSSQL